MKLYLFVALEVLQELPVQLPLQQRLHPALHLLLRHGQLANEGPEHAKGLLMLESGPLLRACGGILLLSPFGGPPDVSLDLEVLVNHFRLQEHFYQVFLRGSLLKIECADGSDLGHFE